MKYYEKTRCYPTHRLHSGDNNGAFTARCGTQIRIDVGKKRQIASRGFASIAPVMSLVPYLTQAFNVFTVIISALIAAVLALSVIIQIKHE